MNSNIPSFDYSPFMSRNNGKTIGLNSECRCGSCSFQTSATTELFRPLIWLILILAIIAWFFYSIVMQKPRFKSQRNRLRFMRGG